MRRFAPSLFAFSSFFSLANALSGCGGSTADPATATGAGGSTGVGGSTAAAGGAGSSVGGAAGAATTTGAGGATGGAGGAPWSAGGPVTTYSPTFATVEAAPGTEDTQCITFKLANPDVVNIRRFSTQLALGTHHIILYKSKETVEAPKPVPCGGLSGILKGEHPLFIAQQAHSELLLPTAEDGTPVALQIEAHQMVRMEMHFINTTAAPIQVSGSIDLDSVPASTTITKGDLAFWGTQNIKIPPNGAYDTGVKFQSALAGTKSFAVTTHQHHLGTRMQVWYATGGPGDLGQKVADSTSWSDPKLNMYSPPLSFDPGASTGFAYQCEWQNTTDQMVKFGESFNDEMCFLWHYYYPSQGFQVCMDGFCIVK